MPVIEQANTLGAALKWEQENRFSREEVTVKSGQNLSLLEVIGKQLLSTPTTGTAGANTGNGTCTGVSAGAGTTIGAYSLTCITGGGAGAITTPATGTAGTNAGANTMTGVAAGAKIKAGTYRMVCVDASAAGAEVFQVTDPDGLLLPNATVGEAYDNEQIDFTINDPGANAQVGDSFTVLATAAAGNSGTFAIKAPDGTALPNATVGVAYANPQLNLTINDGATDFAVGDTFTITVAAGDGKARALDLDAVDGTQHPAGFMVAACDATSADAKGVAIVRDAIIVDNLVWPAGITGGQKTAALAELEDLGILTRAQA